MTEHIKQLHDQLYAALVAEAELTGQPIKMVEYPTAFFQELQQALVSSERPCISSSEVRIILTETEDSENYRIEHHPQTHQAIYYWEGNDWPTVLEEFVKANQHPF